MKPLVFVSHSTHGDSPNKVSLKLMEELNVALSPDWELFIDREKIDPADRWRPKVLRAIDAAQAAIILFDENSIKSDWVAAETLKFCFTSSMTQGEFKVIPVYVGSLSPKTNQNEFKKFEPFQLAEIQGIVIGDSTEGTAERVKELLSKSRQASSGWIFQMRNRLQCLPKDNIADAFWDAKIDFNAYSAEIHRCAAQLLHHEPLSSSIDGFRMLLRAYSDHEDPSKGILAADLYVTRWIENEEILQVIYASYQSGPTSTRFQLAAPLEPIVGQRRIVDLIKDRINEETGGKITICFIDQALPAQSQMAIQYIRHEIAKHCGLGRLWGKNAVKLNASETIECYVSNHQGRRIVCFLPQALATNSFLEILDEYAPDLVRHVVFVFMCEMTTAHLPNDTKKLMPTLDFDRINSFVALTTNLLPWQN